MAVPGTMGKILLVDLTKREISVETPSDDLYLKYLGGYGLGAYYLYKLQPPHVDALSPEAYLGFFTGLLTGTSSITSNRYFVVGKSPKTGTWGDANSGGTFGPKMKAAGFDAVLFTGKADKPVYLLLNDGQAELVDAGDWWGMDTNDLEDEAVRRYGKKAGVACIGPPGQRQSLLACVINDKGRAAGRSGLGAVMGSKNLKAIVAVGDQQIGSADPEGMKKAIAGHRDFAKQQGFFEVLSQYGTAGLTAASTVSADCPIKNWAGVPDDFPTAAKISDDSVMSIQRRKYACWRCPIGCGGETVVEEGANASHTHKPEYETLGAFGSMCLNDDLASINKCNEICNRQGLDTISTACTVAFAIECYENGLITDDQTGGLQLNWGNADAIVEITRQIAHGTGFGKVLADGTKVAAQRIGKGAEKYAVHVAGEETPMHDPRLNPGLATSYKMDATPGRHTQMGSWTVEGQFAPPGLVDVPDDFDKYKYEGKGRIHATVSNAYHAATAAGVCMFGWVNVRPSCLTDSLTYTTGRTFTQDDVIKIGARIATLRIAFNLREGFRNVDIDLPGRMIGNPPLQSGPNAGVSIDVDVQTRDYCAAMGWDAETGVPTKDTLEDLELDFAVADLHA